MVAANSVFAQTHMWKGHQVHEAQLNLLAPTMLHILQQPGLIVTVKKSTLVMQQDNGTFVITL